MDLSERARLAVTFYRRSRRSKAAPASSAAALHNSSISLHNRLSEIRSLPISLEIDKLAGVLLG